MKKRRLYAAYGSNMNIEQMARRCPTARIIGKGLVKGYRLVFRGMCNNAYATIEPIESVKGDNSNYIPVVIWELQKSDEQALDRYEGYPTFYRKEQIVVHTFQNECIEDVMVYIMNKGLRRDVNLPSKHYYEIIKEGYRQNELKDDKLEFAYGRTKEAIRIVK